MHVLWGTLGMQRGDRQDSIKWCICVCKINICIHTYAYTYVHGSLFFSLCSGRNWIQGLINSRQVFYHGRTHLAQVFCFWKEHNKKDEDLVEVKGNDGLSSFKILYFCILLEFSNIFFLSFGGGFWKPAPLARSFFLSHWPVTHST